MAKTTRSHPTSPFVLPEPFLWTILIFSTFGPKMELRFLYFPTSLQVKKLAPKGKKMRMEHPFILFVCRNVIYYIVFTMIVSLWGKSTF